MGVILQTTQHFGLFSDSNVTSETLCNVKLSTHQTRLSGDTTRRGRRGLVSAATVSAGLVCSEL